MTLDSDGEMMWYTASLLFKSHHRPDSVPGPLWEEQIVLIQATSDFEAEKRASEIGVESQHSYENDQGEVVTWSFEKVERIFKILDEGLTDGTEVFSRFLREGEAESLLRPFDEN